MMDCRHVKPLLPLWVGQDLPDAATTNDVARHLEQCPECSKRRHELQQSLEILQTCSAESFSLSRRSVWPKLATRITDWEVRQQQERFNGWIPATVMALAVALMVAVSLPSIQETFFGNESTALNAVDLFETKPDFGFPGHRTANLPGSVPQLSRGTPVNYTPDQW